MSKVYTEVAYHWRDGRYVADLENAECFEYNGAVALCGGGPSKSQEAAAASQANLTNQLASTANRQQDFFEKQQGAANPFYTSRMNNGLPFFDTLTDQAGGTTARAFAPARQQLLQSMGQSSGLPSGFRQQALTDLDAQQGRAYDQNLTSALFANEQAKQGGAAGIIGQAQVSNPLGYYGGAMQGNQSILQAPLQKPGIAGLLGGFAGGAAKAFAGGA